MNLEFDGVLPGTRAVVFDFDGVVLESADIKTDAFLELFKDFPEHRDSIRDLHLRNVGISRFRKFEWIFRDFLKRELTSAESVRLGAQFSDLVRAKIRVCPFVPGMPDVLGQLRETHRLFVVSGTPHEELLEIIDERRLDEFFEGVWGSPPGKVDSLERILSANGFDREEVVMIGDGESDHSAATTVGIHFIARDTPPFHHHWVDLGVPRMAGLERLPEILAAAIPLEPPVER